MSTCIIITYLVCTEDFNSALTIPVTSESSVKRSLSLATTPVLSTSSSMVVFSTKTSVATRTTTQLSPHLQSTTTTTTTTAGNYCWCSLLSHILVTLNTIMQCKVQC